MLCDSQLNVFTQMLHTKKVYTKNTFLLFVPSVFLCIIRLFQGNAVFLPVVIRHAVSPHESFALAQTHTHSDTQ